MLFKNESKEKLNFIYEIVTKSERGIVKRIDENRELLELLLLDMPDFMREKPWVYNWIKSQDEFLMKIANGLEIEISEINTRQFPEKNNI